MGRYVEILWKHKNLAPRKVVREAATSVLLKKIDEYDALAKGPFSRAGDFWKEMTEGYAASRLVKRKEYKVILDAGTGIGFAAYFLALRFPDAKVYGVDILGTEKRRTYWEIISEITPNVEFIVDDVRNVAKKIRPDLVVGVHNCKSLSIFDIDIAAENNADLLLIPCCEDFGALERAGVNLDHLKVLTGNTRNRYFMWVIGLAEYAMKRGLQVETGVSRMLEKATQKNAFVRTL